jgi:hypothetical protein
VRRMRSSSNKILEMFGSKPDSPIYRHVNSLMIISQNRIGNR